MNLRKLARGKECQVRIPGVCNHNNETTVLAHLRMAGITGAGQKAPDLLGSWCCSACHAEIDGQQAQQTTLSYEALRLAHLEGIMRTQYELIKAGVVKW